jgi:hypothetical protein
MTDLTLQGYRDLLGERLGNVLSSEKKKMFGEKEFPANEREDNRLCSSLVACSLANVRKEGT